jgi:hypothetical protein
MFKIKEIVKTANEARAAILKDKYVNLTEIHHLIYAAATVIAEEINGTGCYKSDSTAQNHPRGPDAYRRV